MSRRIVWGAVAVLVMTAMAVGAAAPRTRTIRVGDTTGYLAQPAGAGRHPAVIVIQEWWGLNSWVKLQARKLAEQGYVALAPDLYHGHSTDQPQEAMKLVRAFNPARGLAELQASYAWLKRDRAVKQDEIGVIGWCFGGGQAARLAVAQPGLKAVVIYYGELPTDPASIQRLTMPVLGNFGGADRNITPAKVKAFAAAMEAAGHPADVKIYAFMPHAFAGSHVGDLLHNPQRNEDVADAWLRTLRFLKAHLG